MLSPRDGMVEPGMQQGKLGEVASDVFQWLAELPRVLALGYLIVNQDVLNKMAVTYLTKISRYYFKLLSRCLISSNSLSTTCNR